VRSSLKSRQLGATAVEFALVLLIFLTFLLAVVDFSRLLFTWNAATEATRAGARYAAVCDDKTNKAQVLAKMQNILPQITDHNLDGVPANCTTATCQGVTVTIVGLNFKWISPIAGVAGLAPKAIPQPTFRTFLTREMMRTDPNSNTIC
jgi:hypothetical protein